MQIINKKPYLTVLIIHLTFSVGCVAILPEPHKVDIHQGNIIDAGSIAQVELGMSKDQVRYLLGSPVSNNPFHANRWDYLHYISKAGTYAEPKRVTVYFENERVSAIEDNYNRLKQ